MRTTPRRRGPAPPADSNPVAPVDEAPDDRRECRRANYGAAR
jgi:hypothetical protein